MSRGGFAVRLMLAAQRIRLRLHRYAEIQANRRIDCVNAGRDAFAQVGQGAQGRRSIAGNHAVRLFGVCLSDVRAVANEKDYIEFERCHDGRVC